MKVFLMDQLTPEWWEVRRGMPTASCFDKIMTLAKRQYSASAPKYIATLIGEAIDQRPNYFSTQGGPVTAAMTAGQVNEPEARRFLCMDLNTKIDQVGFCITDDFRFACSPDGLIGLQRSREPAGTFHGQPYYDATCEGAVEIKCPNPDTHVLTLLTQECPAENPQQTHGHLIVTGAKYCWFLSYYPELDPYLKHTEPDDFTADLGKMLDRFHQELLTAADRIIHKKPLGARPQGGQ